MYGVEIITPNSALAVYYLSIHILFNLYSVASDCHIGIPLLADPMIPNTT